MADIVVLVSNDLEYDQRVAKVCSWLHGNGYTVTLVGRRLPGSRDFTRPYEIIRFRLWANRGAAFYALLSIRLFFFLLFRKADVILANDLDTLPAAFLVSRIRRKRLVYDSHEYFTEAEGLTGRPFQKGVWKAIERFIFPRLSHVYTVNESIASIYRKQYHVPVQVVRNVPEYKPMSSVKSRSELQLPEEKPLLILQGAFIDPDRGGRELVEAMQYLPGVHLLIVGSGRDMPAIDAMIAELNLGDRITRLPRLPYEELRHYTANADIGLSLDKPVHLNYTYSLPNKLFDYLHAGIPVIASDLPELRRIVGEYQVGMLLSDITPHSIAAAVTSALASSDLNKWKANAREAARELNWQNESEVLRQIYST
jgi:glycosyltransferase involved in cell wall biosynthesis